MQHAGTNTSSGLSSFCINENIDDKLSIQILIDVSNDKVSLALLKRNYCEAMLNPYYKIPRHKLESIHISVLSEL